MEVNRSHPEPVDNEQKKKTKSLYQVLYKDRSLYECIGVCVIITLRQVKVITNCVFSLEVVAS